MNNMKTQINKCTVRTTTIELDSDDLILALLPYLKKKYPELRVKVEDLDEMFFRVPSGGDWSNTEITIDKDNPIRVVFRKDEREDITL